MAWRNITTLDSPFKNRGRTYRVLVEGEQRPEGTWAGRVVFADGTKRRVTAQETSQPDRKALEYWATGLEPVYLEGALQRAHDE